MGMSGRPMQPAASRVSSRARRILAIQVWGVQKVGDLSRMLISPVTQSRIPRVDPAGEEESSRFAWTPLGSERLGLDSRRRDSPPRPDERARFFRVAQKQRRNRAFQSQSLSQHTREQQKSRHERVASEVEPADISTWYTYDNFERCEVSCLTLYGSDDSNFVIIQQEA